MPTPHRLALTFVVSFVASTAAASPLWPSVGERIAVNAASVGPTLLRAIAEAQTLDGDRLRSVIDSDAGVRVYHRDDRLLIAMSTRRNLTPGEKRASEAVATDLTRTALEQRLRHLLETPEGFQSLGPQTIRVVLVEPDAFQPYVRSAGVVRGAAGGFTSPVPFAAAGLWAGGSPTVTACVGCSGGCN